MGWPLEEGFDWQPSYNVAPSMRAPVVPNLERPVVTLCRWGLIPQWAKDQAIGNRLINARAETVADKPAFRQAVRKRRCLILANGFYEWKREEKGKTPYYIELSSNRPAAFAGLWEQWQGPEGGALKTFAVITTEANALMAPIHNRMPVILPPETFARWLAPEPVDPKSLSDLLVPYAATDLVAFPVSKMVNSPTHNAPELIRPV